MALTHEEKLQLMRSLNWDYNTPYEEMLAVIENDVEGERPFDRKTLFTRSLERLRWWAVVELWGIERVKKLWTPEIRRRLWPPSRREDYDITFALLRGEPVPALRWGSERARALQRTFESKRWKEIRELEQRAHLR
jgi:hypothetical protein